MPINSNPQFALVVGAARSGTTLQRLLLDAHPEIGCPAEAGLPSLMSHMSRVWSTIESDVTRGVSATDPGQDNPAGADGRPRTSGPQDRGQGEGRKPDASDQAQLPDAAREWIRDTVLVSTRRYCGRENKRLYVDKSLDSVYHCGLVHRIFPDSRYMLAFRHVMDTIASGIEASPWGFQAYGYGPYVQATPNNAVAALARYWLDHVSLALEWESQHPSICMRVRYEDLVSDPERLVAMIQRFLGVKEDSSVLLKAFSREPARGPGDYKIEHTAIVHRNSVGHGKRVPVDMLPQSLLSAINEKLDVLGYAAVDHSWNAAERSVDLTEDTIWSQRLQALFAHAANPTPLGNAGPFAVLAEDRLALRWIIDPRTGTITRGDGEVEVVLTGTVEDLVLMLTNEENLGVLLRSGRIRYVTADEQSANHGDFRSELSVLIAVLRSCMRESPFEAS